LTGQWDESEQLTSELVSLCREYSLSRHLLTGRYIQGLTRAARGDAHALDQFRAEVAESGQDARTGLIRTGASHIAALQASAAGDHEAGFRELVRISQPGELSRYNPHALWVLFDVIETAVATGRSDAASAHVTTMLHHGIHHISPRLRMVVAGCAALVAPAGSRDVLYRDALGVPQSPQWPFDRARIELCYGEDLRRSRDLRRAQQHLASALDVFHRLGAQPWAERAAAALRAAGAEPAGPRAPVAGDVALTARERQVAELAARGLTNREIGERLFLSPRSVGATMYRLFPKLGITSRAALDAALQCGTGLYSGEQVDEQLDAAG